jgi:hypothetical protein
MQSCPTGSPYTGLRAGTLGGCLYRPHGSSSTVAGVTFFRLAASSLSSKNQEPAQVRYLAFDKELLACCAGIRHFWYMLEGRPFVIYTVHTPLTFALSKLADSWTAMQCGQLSYVAEFTADIRHVPGVENIVAKMLSKPPSHIAGPDSDSPSHIVGRNSFLPATTPERIAVYLQWMLCLLARSG